MLKCEIRADNTLHIEGYVNAVERDSKPIIVSGIGKCVEQVRAGVFGAALAGNPMVEILENHDRSRKLGSTADGALSLSEDSIGLRASADISDADIVEKARTGQLKGWSFGFIAKSQEIEQRAENIPRRVITGMTLTEVSLIDGKYSPCYSGTLVEVRAADTAGETVVVEFRADEDIVYSDSSDSSGIDFDFDFGSESDLGYYERARTLLELRYNPYHDPSNGRFCSGGGGGGGGVLYVGKGQKGKGVYVVDVDHDDEYEKWKAAKAGGISDADKAIREATGGVIQKDEYTIIDGTATKKNKRSPYHYDRQVYTADVDSNGNVKLDYAKAEYFGNYGDMTQNVQYKIKAGVVDGEIVNLDLSKATTIKGHTYDIKEQAKEAGMVWNPRSDSWVKKDHPLNTKTRYSDSELSAMSDSDLNKIYNAVFYNVGIYKGNTFNQLDSAVSRNEGVARDKKISTIIKYNSMKEFGGG